MENEPDILSDNPEIKLQGSESESEPEPESEFEKEYNALSNEINGLTSELLRWLESLDPKVDGGMNRKDEKMASAIRSKIGELQKLISKK